MHAHHLAQSLTGALCLWRPDSTPFQVVNPEFVPSLRENPRMSHPRNSTEPVPTQSALVGGLGRGLLVLWMIAAATLVQARSAPQVWAGEVTHVSDGDTIWVRSDAGGPPRSVRLDGIDAPERCQQYGEVARAALIARIGGRHVQLRVRRHDDYGRALATVRLQGEDVGGWMVSHGHAWSYRFRGQPGPYAQEEAHARRARIGLFGEPGEPESPRTFRRRHGSCHRDR